MLSTNVSAQSPPCSRNARAVGDVGQPVVQLVHFGRQRDRRDALQHRADVRDGLRVGPLRLLRGGTGERVVQPLAQVGGQGRQLGQHFDGGVDGPVHDLRVEPRRRLTRSGRLARRRPFWLSPIRTDSAHLANGYLPLMGTLLWILAVILVVAGIFAIIRRQLIWGIVLIIVGLLVGPGGVSIFT